MANSSSSAKFDLGQRVRISLQRDDAWPEGEPSSVHVRHDGMIGYIIDLHPANRDDGSSADTELRYDVLICREGCKLRLKAKSLTPAPRRPFVM